MSEVSNSYEEKCDEFRQRHHSITLTLENKKASTEYLRSDIEAMKDDSKKTKESLLTKAQRDYEEKNSALRNEGDVLHNKIQDLHENKRKLELIVNELKKKNDYLKTQKTHFKKPEDHITHLKGMMIAIRQTEYSYRRTIERKDSALREFQTVNQDLAEKLQIMQISIEHKDELIEEYKESIKTHKIKMEAMKENFESLQFANIDVNKKGNSLFSEIEDRKNFLKQRTAALKLMCERIERDVERNKLQMKRTLDGMNAWSLYLTDNRFVNQEFDTLQQKINEGKRYIEKMWFIKRNRPDLIALSFHLNVKPNKENTRSRLDCIRFLIAKGKKAIKLQKLLVASKKNKLDIATTERKRIKIMYKGSDPFKLHLLTEEQNERALAFLKFSMPYLNEFQDQEEAAEKAKNVKFAESTDKKKNSEEVKKDNEEVKKDNEEVKNDNEEVKKDDKGEKDEIVKNKTKSEPVDVSEPVLESCKQQ